MSCYPSNLPHNTMVTSTRFPVHEESQVGEARRTVNERCVRIGGNATFCGRASLVASELARNLVLHGGGGDIIFRELLGTPHPAIEILSLDGGCGMKNVAECLRDGFSTAGTAGTGLGAVRRLADLFELNTREGGGTVISTRIYQCSEEVDKTPRKLGAVSIPIHTEEICGDCWGVIHSPKGMRVMVADGLGHGTFAAEASMGAVSTFRAHPGLPLAKVLERVHEALTKTRGAAAAIAEILPGEGKISMAGVGNIVVRTFDGDGKSRQMASSNGTLGGMATRIHEYTGAWSPESTLVMHSDGLRADWSPERYPGLLHRHPSVVAGVLFRDFARDRDDATVMVASCPE